MYEFFKNKEKKVLGMIVNIYFPKGHSNVKKIIFHRWDENVGDPWANISDNHYILHVLWKGHEDWDILCNGNRNESCPYSLRGCGLDNLLHQMETPLRRKKIEKKWRINSLQKCIKKDEKELKKLLGK